MLVENKLHDLSSDVAILLCAYKNWEIEKHLDKSWEIEKKDLENGLRVYEKEKKEKKEKKSKSENNITMHFCTMIAYMLIVNEIRVLQKC